MWTGVPTLGLDALGSALYGPEGGADLPPATGRGDPALSFLCDDVEQPVEGCEGSESGRLLAAIAPAPAGRAGKLPDPMFSSPAISTENKPAFYAELTGQLRALLTGERDWLANFANTSALIFHALPDLNWAGFYLLRGDELVLGPFQGKPACVRIAPGRGVCGGAVAQRRSLVVADVHEFPGHIACDAASRAELVVPMITGGRVVGVLDLDSPRPGRFDEADRAGCEGLVAILLAASDGPA